MSGSLALLLVAAEVFGQERARVEADRTFHEARALLAGGHVSEACSKFAQSQALLPRNGTLLNLAVCLEQAGRNVEAIRRFEEALVGASKSGRTDREELARAHLRDLHAKVAWLSIDIRDARNLADLEVFVDGLLWTSLGSLQPIESGSHRVTAKAPGRAPFDAVVLVEVGASRHIEILEPASTAVEPRMSPASPVDRAERVAPLVPTALAVADASVQPWRKPLGVALIGLGAATAAAGGLFGLRALLDGDDLRRICPDLRCASETKLAHGRQLNARATTEARVANVAIPLGVIVAGAGAYLWLSQPRGQVQRTPARTADVEVRAAASPSLLGAQVSGTW